MTKKLYPLIPSIGMYLLKEDKSHQTSKGGVIVVQGGGEDDTHVRATVLDAGPDDEENKLKADCQQGDQVILGSYNVARIFHNGEEFILCGFKAVIAKVRKD